MYTNIYTQIGVCTYTVSYICTCVFVFLPFHLKKLWFLFSLTRFFVCPPPPYSHTSPSFSWPLSFSLLLQNRKGQTYNLKQWGAKIIILKEASRWRKCKTWRSPSSPQIRQKYIYMWNTSYRAPTERWQKTSDLPKGKKLPTYLGRAKEKRKKQRQRIGTGPAPVGGSCEGGKVSTH